MNQRIKNKLMHKSLDSNVKHCINYDGCYEECTGCEYTAKSYLKQQLRRYGYSLSGWKLFEVPANGVYVFRCNKKNKEIILESSNKRKFNICVADWKHHTNVVYPNIKEAMESPHQNSEWVYIRPTENLSQWRNQKRLWRYHRIRRNRKLR